MVSKRWSWVAGLAVLFAGLTNAHSHIHYCFDGQELPAALHLADSPVHDHEHPGGHDGGPAHDDLDVDLKTDVLPKAGKLDLPAVLPAAWAVTLDSPRDRAFTEAVDDPPTPHPRYTLPPLRAPPL
jgi:hypothetical protein